LISLIKKEYNFQEEFDAGKRKNRQFEHSIERGVDPKDSVSTSPQVIFFGLKTMPPLSKGEGREHHNSGRLFME
jgi:hypothetical protein